MNEIILLIIGLAALFLGYRIKKAAFFVIWFVLGYQLMTYFQPTLTSWFPEVLGTELYQTLLPIAGGLLLGLLGFSIEKFCVGAICFALTIAIAIQYYGASTETIAIAGVIGVVVAGLSTMLMKPATILATSAAGAYAFVIALFALVPTLDQSVYYFPILIGSGVLGAIVQFLTTKRVR